MDSDAFRDKSPEPEDSELYWRRRITVLVGVLLLAGLLAWACSGGERDPRRTAATRSLDPATAAGTPIPAVTVTVTATHQPPATSPPRRAGDACDPRDVVLRLTVDQDAYAAGQTPTLTLSVVNTGRRPCTLDLGSKALEIVIRSGPDRVWSSADCARGDGSRVRRLDRGVPALVSLRWERVRSSRRCPDNPARALPGTYLAQARQDRLRSNTEVFRLR